MQTPHNLEPGARRECPPPAPLTAAARAYRDVNRALLGLLLLVAGITLLRIWAPAWAWLPFGACASQRVLGLDCPLCGVTRGLAAVLRGEWAAARALNPLSLVVAVLIPLEAGYRALGATASGARLLTPSRRVDQMLHIGFILLYVAWTTLLHSTR